MAQKSKKKSSGSPMESEDEPTKSDAPQFYFLVTPNPCHDQYITEENSDPKTIFHYVKFGDQKSYDKRVEAYRTNNPTFFYRQCHFPKDDPKNNVGKDLERELLNAYKKCGWEKHEKREWHRLENKLLELKAFCQWLETTKADKSGLAFELSKVDTEEQLIEKFKDVVGLGP